MSPVSLLPYARLDPLEYGRHLIQATSVQVEGVTNLNLPRLDNDDLAISCQPVLNIVGTVTTSGKVPCDHSVCEMQLYHAALSLSALSVYFDAFLRISFFLSFFLHFSP